MDKKLEKEKEKVSILRQQVVEARKFAKLKSFDFISAGLGIVAGLAWNEAIKAFIEYFFPLNQSSIAAKFIYAVFITLFVVLLTFYFSKALGIKAKSKHKEAGSKDKDKDEDKSE